MGINNMLCWMGRNIIPFVLKIFQIDIENLMLDMIFLKKNSTSSWWVCAQVLPNAF